MTVTLSMGLASYESGDVLFDQIARRADIALYVAKTQGRDRVEIFNSARHVGRQHLLDPYREDLRPVADEGFGAYARRVSRPYAEAVARHFSADAPSLTERGLERLRLSRHHE